VRIQESTSGSDVSITVKQVDPRFGDKGILFWGFELEKMYRELGVTIDQTTLTQLYPPRILRNEMLQVARDYLLLMAASFILVLYLFSLRLDILFTYCFVFVVPITFLYGSKYLAYRKIRDRTVSPEWFTSS
jgi:hypothetical protein